jgi:UDP-N-acetylglucosamine 3-dehydrogenase
MDVVKMAVVGVGAKGQNHARVINDMDGASLEAVVDASPERARAVGERFKVPWFSTLEECLKHKKIDAAIVACPTVYHKQMSMTLLQEGIHVLVEKPIAFTVCEAEAMIRCAEENKRLLAVGHIERFNPAIVELKRRLDRGDAGKIFMIHSRRQSPLPTRIVDVGVGMDLATHELDMMRFLTGARVASLSAEVSQVTKAKAREDVIFALLRFDSDVLGILDVNWITPTQVREISVTCEKGLFTANYHTQELFFYENQARPEGQELTNWGSEREFAVEAGNMTRFQIVKREPLRLELEAFANAVRTGANEAPCTGRDGYQALSLAWEIVTTGRASRVVTP